MLSFTTDATGYTSQLDLQLKNKVDTFICEVNPFKSKRTLDGKNLRHTMYLHDV